MGGTRARGSAAARVEHGGRRGGGGRGVGCGSHVPSDACLRHSGRISCRQAARRPHEAKPARHISGAMRQGCENSGKHKAKQQMTTHLLSWVRTQLTRWVVIAS